MALTPINNGNSGASARGKINTSFSQTDTNTSDLLTKQPLDADLTSIAALSSTGLIARTGSGAMSTRTLIGTVSNILVTDGDGVSGNPTLNIGANVVDLNSVQTLTNKTLTSPTITTPSGLTKSDVGLGNIDNTSDLNKPVSTATQTALNLKQDANARTTLSNEISNETIGRAADTGDKNRFIRFTIGTAQSYTFPPLAGFGVGYKVMINNSDSSTQPLTLNTSGGATLETGVLAASVPRGTTACVMKIDTSAWLRIW